MKIIAIALVLCMTGCAMLEQMSDEELQAFSDNVASGVVSAVHPIIDTLPVPEVVKEPAKGILDYLVYAGSALIIAWMGKRGYSAVKASKPGSVVG